MDARDPSFDTKDNNLVIVSVILLVGCVCAVLGYRLGAF